MGFLETLGAPSTLAPTGGFLANLGNNSPTIPPAPTGQLGLPGVDVAKDYAGSVVTSAKSGIDQAKAGYSKAANANNPLDLLEGGAALGAGAINTLTSPLAPVFKPVSDAIKFVGDKISDVPAVQKFANTPLGGAVSRGAEDVANLSTIAGGVTGVEGAPELPTAAAKVGNTTENALSKVDTRLGGSAAVKAADAATTQAKAAAIDYTNRALGNTGKKTASTILSNDTKRLSGLETFYTMAKDQPVKAPDGTTFQFDPTHITDPHQMLQAFVQAKQNIWQKVQAGLDKGSSVKPDYTPVKRELQGMIDSPGSTAQAKSHAATRLAEINGLEKGGVGDAQTYLQQLNSRLGATFSGASDAIPNQIDAKVANGVNGALDKGLETVKDANIRPLKDMYASLKSIEPDLVKTTQKIVRSTGNGIPQYINDFGNINLLEAIFAHNPALYVAKGAAMKIMSKVLGGERDPLVNLSKAFQNVAKYHGVAAPVDAPVLALPPGNRGAASQVSSGAPINLPAAGAGNSNTRTTFGLPPLNK
jgi:hypothetical protein